jgi:hypothetical protein
MSIVSRAHRHVDKAPICLQRGLSALLDCHTHRPRVLVDFPDFDQLQLSQITLRLFSAKPVSFNNLRLICRISLKRSQLILCLFGADCWSLPKYTTRCRISSDQDSFFSAQVSMYSTRPSRFLLKICSFPTRSKVFMLGLHLLSQSLCYSSARKTVSFWSWCSICN